jgi:hypothetical protein
MKHLPGPGWRREGKNAEAEPDPEYVDLAAHPELEPDLGPTPESIAHGAEPDDALYIDREWAPDPPEVELDTAYGAAQARRQLAEALAAAREPDPELEAE